MDKIIVGVRFRKAGKVYYFDPGDMQLEVNDHVVVETARGLELGEVALAPQPATEEESAQPLKSVIRKAEERDLKKAGELEAKEKEALAECAKLVEKLELPMKLLSAEYNLDGSRLTLHFSAAERVDFRELVRELAGKMKVRVEMRQTGPRDEAKLIGGCGRCGRPLCCGTFLSEFAPVSMRMAKDQGLPLNPMKISGVCGRLMCCLVYENEQYIAMRGKLPKNGQMVMIPPDGVIARVVDGNVLKETVTVELESKATQEFPVKQIVVDIEKGWIPLKPVEPEIREKPEKLFENRTQEKPSKDWKPERREKPEKRERNERRERPERHNKPDKPEVREKPDNNEKPGNQQPDNQHRQNKPRYNNRNRRNRQNRQDNPNNQEKPNRPEDAGS